MEEREKRITIFKTTKFRTTINLDMALRKNFLRIIKDNFIGLGKSVTREN